MKLRALIPTEYEEQRAVMDWKALAQRRYPELELLIASATGVRLSIGAARKAKAAGMLPKGLPDLWLPVAKPAYPQAHNSPLVTALDWTAHSLFIELKRRSLGRYSIEQAWWFNRLIAQGNAVAGCRGATETIDTIVAYLEGKFVQRASLEG